MHFGTNKPTPDVYNVVFVHLRGERHQFRPSRFFFSVLLYAFSVRFGICTNWRRWLSKDSFPHNARVGVGVCITDLIVKGPLQ